MSEHELDPQRPPASADAEPSHPTAELPRVERGQSGSTPHVEAAGQPTHPQPAADQPASSGAYPTSGGYPAAPASGGYPAAHPTSGPGSYPTSGAYQPGSWQPGYPAPHAIGQTGQPSHPGHAQPGQPGHPGQQGWSGSPGYAGTQVPGAIVPPYQQQHFDGGNPPPPWAQGPGAPARQPGRAGRFAAIGALALALMAGSGIAGGAIALAFDDHAGGVTKTYSAAPILNQADLPKIAASVQNSVVSITTQNGEGSGVVLSADGYVLTNNHVLASATGDTVKVVFADGKTATARIVGTDPKTDLGVVKASGVSNLTPAKFGDSDAMQVGDTVLALGSPLGLEGSVTAGIISARDRTIQTADENQQQQQQQNPFQPQQQQQQAASSISGLLQTDAPINPGNSGGALVNTKGEVIGINTAIATSGQSSGNIGVGFAIPSNKAKAVSEALRSGQKISHPSLGVSVGAAENGGALVNSVTPGSPAEKAGLQQGDVITKFGGKQINDSNDLVGAVQGGKVGDQVEVTYTRNGAEKKATVTLAETS